MTPIAVSSTHHGGNDDDDDDDDDDNRTEVLQTGANELGFNLAHSCSEVSYIIPEAKMSTGAEEHYVYINGARLVLKGQPIDVIEY